MHKGVHPYSLKCSSLPGSALQLYSPSILPVHCSNDEISPRTPKHVYIETRMWRLVAHSMQTAAGTTKHSFLLDTTTLLV